MENVTYAKAEVAGPARRPTSIIATIIQAISGMFEAARARRRLEALPDYMLRDIGIGRAEIGSAVRYGRPRSAAEDIVDSYAMLFEGPRNSGQTQTRI